LPRLSVDIDLTYLPVENRAISLVEIDAALRRIARRIPAAIGGARAILPSTPSDGTITKLAVRSDGMQIKIEVTPVLRGCVFDPTLLSIATAVEEQFGFAEIQVVSFADLYAGKIVAALDRQHPRDLFDVRGLLANEGIDDALRRAFLVYLISHDRPMGEVLEVHRKDITREFEHGFAGMTAEQVTLEELLAAREALIEDIIGRMPNNHRAFLLSFERRGEADWGALKIDSASDLPAVRWRRQNLASLTPAKRTALVSKLAGVLAKQSE
jgi:hypothetical protein